MPYRARWFIDAFVNVIRKMKKRKRGIKTGENESGKVTCFGTFQEVKAEVKHFLKKCKNITLSTPPIRTEYGGEGGAEGNF